MIVVRKIASVVSVLAALAATPLAAQDCQVLAGPAAVERGLTAVNGHRGRASLRALAINARLARAARAHACDMALTGIRSHTGSNGSSVGDRISAQGYRFCSAAENVAWGQAGLPQAVGSWMNSSPHRANILNGTMRHVGLAGARGRNGEPVWVMVLARPC